MTPLVRLRSLVLVPLVFFGFVALLGSPASADAASKKNSVRILAPKEGSHPGGKTIVAKVRVQGKGFRAYLNGRNFTGRFRSVKGNRKVRRAVFRRGKDFKIGPADLFVMVGKGYRPATHQVYFTAVRRQDRSLRVKRASRPVALVPRIQIRAQGRLRSSTVWLNGKKVGGRFDRHDDLRGLGGQLGGPYVRHGINRLKVRVMQRNGAFALKSIRFRVAPTRPIANAGPDRRIGVGDMLTLDSSKSRKPAKGKKAGGPLKMQWKVVSAPGGSTARPVSPTSARTAFTPDVPGNYRLQVVVKSAGGTTSIDEVDIDAPQAIEPMGMPIQTITDQGGAQIGLPDQVGAKSYPKAGNWVQMIVLDPDTATPMSGQWDGVKAAVKPEPGVLGFDQGQGSDLLDAIRKTKFQQMVVLSGQGNSVNMSSSDQSNLKKAIAYLGGTTDSSGTTPQGVRNLDSGLWSVIGHDTLVEGQAYQNFASKRSAIPGFMGGSPGLGGSLNGYLQSGMNTVGYQFVSTDAVNLDTKWTPDLSTPPPVDQNTIRVGSTNHVSQPIDNGTVSGCPCAVGIQLLVLDPANLHPIDSGTYGVLNAGGATVFGGIQALSQKLSQYVNDHAAGSSALIVMQDFGKFTGPNGPRNAPAWIQDSLPDNSYTPRWKGNSFPTGTQLISSWNPNSTVAGAIGKLAGYEAHDIVANYRRPVFDITRGQVVNRDWGGLSVVATTNLYQWPSAFIDGQGDLAPKADNPLLNNGRITGALMRNEQSQWELTGAAHGAGYPGAINTNDPNSPDNAYGGGELAELVYSEPTPWPCSEEQPAPCLGTSDEVKGAMLYITQQLELGPTTVRNSYTNDNITWSDERLDLQRVSCSTPGISEPVCDEMKVVLDKEFEQLDRVWKSFNNLRHLLDDSNKEVQFNLGGIGSQVTGAIAQARKDLLKQEAKDVNIAGIVSEALYIGSDILELSLDAEQPELLEAAPAEMNLTASLIGMGEELFPFFESNSPKGQERVKNATDLVNDRVGNLSRDMNNQLIQINGTLKHFHDLVRTDPVKLKTAFDNFGSKWALDTKNEQRLAQQVSIGASRSLYESILPIALNQWVISPRNTTLNGMGVRDLPDRGYNCTYLDGEGNIDGYNRPLQNEPASMSGMSSVWWGANYAPNGQGYTVRALKMRADDMKIESAQFDDQRGDNYLEHKGADTPAELLDPLFQPPSDLVAPTLPNALGMSKDELFGQNGWQMKKLQCGFAEN